MEKTNNDKIVFSSAALADIKEAAAWYNAQQKGLGKRLKEDIKLVLSYLIKPLLCFNKI
jgi:hypothetical protein